MIIRQIPENFKLIYSKEDIAYSVYKMAGEMRHWVKDTTKMMGNKCSLSAFYEVVFSFSPTYSKKYPIPLNPHSAER